MQDHLNNYQETSKKNILKKKIIILFLLILSFILAAIILGFNNISYKSTDWFNVPDLLLYQIPWEFFRKDEWRFPIYLNPNYGLGISAPLTYSDNVLILNIIFKLFNNFLPNQFQFFSFWILLCFFLQGFFAFKILKLYTKDNYYSLIGSIFLMLSPILIDRMGLHFPLTAHWLILASIYLIKKNNIEKTNIAWAVLIFISIFINLNLAAMVIIIFGYFLILQLKSIKSLIKFYIPLYGTVVLGSLYLCGIFNIGITNNIEFGYGHYKSNLLSLLDPVGGVSGKNWSYFLPDIKNSNGESEGFAYLGLGGVFLIILFLYIIYKKKLYLKKKFFSYSLLLTCFSLFAFSNNISFASYDLINLELNKYIYGLFGFFRASGRFIWPVWYFIIIFSFVTIYYFFSKKNSLRIIIFLLILQIVDTSEGIYSFGHNHFQKREIKLKDNIWKYTSNNFDYLKTTFPKSSAENLLKFGQYVTDNNFEGTDIIYITRLDRKKLADYRYKLYDNFFKGKIDKKSAYIVDNNHAIQLYKIFQKDDHGFFFRDNTWLLLPDAKEIMNDNDYDMLSLLKPKLIELEEKIIPKKNMKYFGLGWYKSSSFWSDGFKSSILFSKKQGEILRSIEIECEIFNFSELTKPNFKFNLNNKLIEQITYEKNNNLHTIKIDIPENYSKFDEYTLDIINLNKKTRLDLRIAPDPRLLGLKILSIKFIGS